MINYFRKMKLAVWVVVILTVTNLATIGTIVYHSYGRKSDHFHEENQSNHQTPGKFFLQKELNLSPQQEGEFTIYRNKFFSDSKIIFKQLETKRIAIIAEIGKTSPDTTVLYRYSDEIGTMHAALKRLTINHLLDLKKLCTPEQKIKLDSLYQRLIGPEGPMRHRGSKDGWKRDTVNLKTR